MVVVVDDAHELDDASVALLDQMVDTEAIFVILTVRLGAPSVGATLDMWKDLRVLRVQVDPLPPGAMREIASQNLGGPVRPRRCVSWSTPAQATSSSCAS